MFIKEKKFFKPSKQARILSLIEGLSTESGISQFELGRKVGLSGAMVNSYLKEFQKENLLALRPINGKSYAYELTPEGEKLRKNMLGEYSAETVQIYSGLKKTIRDKLTKQCRNNNRLVLFGASETCEIVLSALQQCPYRILAIVDNDNKKHGDTCQGIVISPPAILDTLEFESVIITTFAHQQAIIEQLTSLANKKTFEIIGL